MIDLSKVNEKHLHPPADPAEVAVRYGWNILFIWHLYGGGNNIFKVGKYNILVYFNYSVLKTR